LLFLAVTVRAADPGPKKGFRDLHWGDPPSEEMVSVKIKLAGMDTYLIRDDDGAVAGRDTDFVSYYFFKNALCQVIVGWASAGTRDGLDSIARELVFAWGIADETSAAGERGWLSQDRTTIATLRRVKGGAGAALTIGDLPCSRTAAAAAAGI
jgi:hypothetical protein